jgi:hypothetical protein
MKQAAHTVCGMLISQCQGNGCGCFDEHITYKSGVMGGICSLVSAPASSSFRIDLFLNIAGYSQFNIIM